MNRHVLSRLTLIGLLVLAFGAQAGVVAAEAQGGDSTNASIDRVSTSRAVDVAGHPDTTYVWSQTAEGEAIQSYDVEVQVTAAGNDTEVCLQNACKAVDSGTTSTVVAFETQENGTTNASVVLRNASSGAELDSETVRLHEIDRTGDLDDDGVNNSVEATMGTNVVESDTDDDGLADAEELQQGTNPLKADTDGDGLDDLEELQRGTDPLAADSDGDGLLDGEELQEGTDPLAADSDGDGLQDSVETKYGTDPLKPDTDNDGLVDGKEVNIGTDPLAADSDGDGLDDAEELQRGTDPLTADSDDDGLVDGEEIRRGTDPLAADSDGDGLLDGKELHEGTDPLAADTDGDGLDDAEELRQGTDPLQADTDGDYLADGLEHQFGMDPTNPLTPAWVGAAVFGFISGLTASVVAINRQWTTDAARAIRPSLHRLPLVGPTAIDIDDDPAPTSDSDSDHDPSRNGANDRETVGDNSGTTSTSASDVVEHTELLPDEELVERMLEAEEGRMKQSAIVENTDWSKSKVSRLLSQMADDDDITKVTLGRENLICLAGSVPEIVYPATAEKTGLPGTNTATSE